jgi:hypothetical protein
MEGRPGSSFAVSSQLKLTEVRRPGDTACHLQLSSLTDHALLRLAYYPPAKQGKTSIKVDSLVWLLCQPPQCPSPDLPTRATLTLTAL